LRQQLVRDSVGQVLVVAIAARGEGHHGERFFSRGRVAGTRRGRFPRPPEGERPEHNESNEGGNGPAWTAGFPERCLRRRQALLPIELDGDIGLDHGRPLFQQGADPRAERRGTCIIGRLPAVALAKTGPLHLAKLIRHFRRGIGRRVDHHRQQKRLFRRHQSRALHGQQPLQPKIPFEPRLRAGRNHRHEQRALLDLLPDLRIPRIAADQFVLIEPHFNARGAQRLADAPRHFRIL
jgi:hypothetical protein